MSKRRRGQKRKRQRNHNGSNSSPAPLNQRRKPAMEFQWSIEQKMKWARDAHWYGADDYALECLMEIAQTEINDHVQESFDLSCQPRPARSSFGKTKPKICTRAYPKPDPTPATSIRSVIQDGNGGWTWEKVSD